MEAELNKKKKRSFSRGLLWFSLGLLGLVGVSSLVSTWIPDGMKGTDNRIGLVEVTGMIRGSQDIVRQIKGFREDKRIRGIIIRIDSPGGAVGPSQEIYDEVLKTRKSNKKIYASMGSLAASGGYYIASAADRIFANPGTLTGSIGVIMAFSNIEGLMEKIGLRPEVIKAGKYKDTGSPVRTMSEEERSLLQEVIDDVHQQFIEAVAEGRNLPIEEVRRVADGRILTGRQAHRLNLVDQLGGLQASIDHLAREVGISGPPKIIREKKPVQFLDWILQSILNQSVIKKYLPVSSSPLQYLWPLAEPHFSIPIP
ncbi:MAG: signal peptide peptidase SppA [Nitrospinae bacterium]|nr:signal peptide peptidase SppA [Nitrospinota bacterium]